MPETNEIINEIMSLAPYAPELTADDEAKLDEWLCKEIADKLEAGEPINKELAALEQLDCMRVFNNMLLRELNDLRLKNQQLAIIIYQAGAVTESSKVGTC